MSPTLKYYLKIFIYTVVAFGIICILGDYFRGREFSFAYYVIGSIFFGFIMTFVFAQLTTSNLEEHGILNHTVDHLKVIQKKIIKSLNSIDEINEILSSSDYFKKFKINPSENKIEIRTGISLHSFGEKIVITSLENQDNSNEYEIIVKPIILTTLSNSGRSFLHMNEIEKELITSV